VRLESQVGSVRKGPVGCGMLGEPVNGWGRVGRVEPEGQEPFCILKCACRQCPQGQQPVALR
jgi:hypothetical protein